MMFSENQHQQQVALVPHAAAWAREYTEVMVADSAKKLKKISWLVPGSFWLWSSDPKILRPTSRRLDFSRGGGEIQIIFMPQTTPRFVSVDIYVSAAPPEFANARRYLLRFHLTIVTSRRDLPTPAPKETPEDDRVAHLERIVHTERLMLLRKQCQELQTNHCTPAVKAALKKLTLQTSAFPV